MRMEWRAGEGKVTQTLGDDRAGRDDTWRRMENEGRREEKMWRITSKKPETETVDIVGTAGAEAETNTVGTKDIPQGAGVGRRNAVGTVTPTRGGVGGGRREWESGEFMRYCREMIIDIWEGAWRRAGEEILPRRGVG